MAEAHSAVAFSFTVTPEGVDFDLNHEALWAVWGSGVRSWKKRYAQFRNNLINHAYPMPLATWMFFMSIVLALVLADTDNWITRWALWIEKWPLIRSIADPWDHYVSSLLFGAMLCLAFIAIIRYTLKALLTYQGWMYDARGKMPLRTKLWVLLVKCLVSRTPLLYSYQASLPKLPVPPLSGTVRRYLQSVKPLMPEEKHNRMREIANEFENGIGKKLQRYLTLKSWWATNYVSDWWEEYVYLRGRAPLMVNSNYYGVDAVFIHPTTVQVARAANVIYTFLSFRRLQDREELKPIQLNKTVPLCSWQYERQFNTTRIPGVETDQLVHYKDSKHVCVYHKGRYYKVYVHYKGRLLLPCELEVSLQKILDDESEPVEGEEKLAAMTAGDRIPWAKARKQHFSKGVNKTSLDAVEKAAFFVSLDEEEHGFDPRQALKKDIGALDKFGRTCLHGKGYDRWFDKSFSLIIFKNGKIGFNAEHSWADAPIMAHLWEFSCDNDVLRLGYREDGHCKGEPEMVPPNPIRLQWDLSPECIEVIHNSLDVAEKLLNDVDLHLMMHDAYGKGLMKKCKTSPDAFIQMALQLAYYRDAGRVCLTYEAAMTRLFRGGRTETVRSCTVESTNFVKAMEDKSKTTSERIALFREATEIHQKGYRNAMTGRGIDRHLFCLYVVSKYLGIESPFLKEVLSEPWRLSTSQTPHQQTDQLDLAKNPELISAGGGFGPVADDGYGVSYIIAGEDCLFFHISCKNSCTTTDARRFGRTITKALADIKDLFNTS
ncbi:unnamed protein product [Owenia fusiformis]|uniref:carnitine O-palmitoyltransferase n=1 Tax=Owenia fusiformis TaxID=6347 RepID=A0A8J1TA49_OWEFU|nr:unnamed protein product [Owenia fusiformis]